MNIEAESPVHYILKFPVFANQRLCMLKALLEILPFDLIQTMSDNNLVKFLLTEDADLSQDINLKILEIFHVFIKDPKHFIPQ